MVHRIGDTHNIKKTLALKLFNLFWLYKHMKFKLSDHAKEQMEDRDIPSEMVLEVAMNPEQTYNNDIDETVCQSKVTFGEKKLFIESIRKPHREPACHY